MGARGVLVSQAYCVQAVCNALDCEVAVLQAQHRAAGHVATRHVYKEKKKRIHVYAVTQPDPGMLQCSPTPQQRQHLLATWAHSCPVHSQHIGPDGAIWVQHPDCAA